MIKFHCEHTLHKKKGTFYGPTFIIVVALGVLGVLDCEIQKAFDSDGGSDDGGNGSYLKVRNTDENVPGIADGNCADGQGKIADGRNYWDLDLFLGCLEKYCFANSLCVSLRIEHTPYY